MYSCVEANQLGLKHAYEKHEKNENSDAALLVNASDAFNSLNCCLALYNIRHSCLSLASILINTHREPTNLYVDG